MVTHSHVGAAMLQPWNGRGSFCMNMMCCCKAFRQTAGVVALTHKTFCAYTLDRLVLPAIVICLEGYELELVCVLHFLVRVCHWKNSPAQCSAHKNSRQAE